MKLISKLTGRIAIPGEFSGKISYNADHFKKGEVLAIRQATPFHVEAISKAKGLLLEFPGIIQHAIILAREFEVPSVVGLKGLLKWHADYVIVKNIDDETAEVQLYVF